MKIKIIIVAALCGTLHLTAEPVQQDDGSRSGDQSRRGHNTLGKVEKANKVIGMAIKDAQGEKIGTIKDLAVDLENGRIVEVITATGGILGVDEHLAAIPPSQFTCEADQKSVRLDVDKAQLKAAPEFKMSDWDANVQQGNVTQVYQHYGAKPYFASEDQNQTTRSRFGRVDRASKLIGSTVHNPQNDRVGKVDNLLIDLPAGRVVEVIVSTGGFLGLGDELSAIPPQAFHPGKDRETVSLDTTKEALAQAPHFKSSEWPDFNDPEQTRAVYNAHKVSANFGEDVDNTRQNVRDRSDAALTPPQQGRNNADTETTRRIRRQIIATEGLSTDARNVKIITVDGRVTLRGPVKNEEEKRRIVDIATKETAQGNVDNQIEVEGTTPNSVNQK